MKNLLLIVVVLVLIGFGVSRFVQVETHEVVVSSTVPPPVPVTPPVKPAVPVPVVPIVAPTPTTPAPSKAIVEASKVATPISNPQMVLTDVLGPNNFFHDDLMGVSATYPEGWSVRSAQRWGKNNEQATVFMSPEPHTTAQPSMYYQMYPDGTPDLNQAETYLRNIAQWKEGTRIAAGMSDYKNVPESFAYSDVDGHPTLSYFATFTQGDQVKTEYFVRTLSQKGYVMFFTSGTLEDVKAIMPQIKQMASTVKVP